MDRTPERASFALSVTDTGDTSPAAVTGGGLGHGPRDRGGGVHGERAGPGQRGVGPRVGCAKRPGVGAVGDGRAAGRLEVPGEPCGLAGGRQGLHGLAGSILDRESRRGGLREAHRRRRIRRSRCRHSVTARGRSGRAVQASTGALSRGTSAAARTNPLVEPPMTRTARMRVPSGAAAASSVNRRRVPAGQRGRRLRGGIGGGTGGREQAGPDPASDLAGAGDDQVRGLAVGPDERPAPRPAKRSARGLRRGSDRSPMGWGCRDRGGSAGRGRAGRRRAHHVAVGRGTCAEDRVHRPVGGEQLAKVDRLRDGPDVLRRTPRARRRR